MLTSLLKLSRTLLFILLRHRNVSSFLFVIPLRTQRERDAAEILSCLVQVCFCLLYLFCLLHVSCTSLSLSLSLSLSCIYFWSNQACNLFSFLYPYSILTLVKEVLVRLRLSILVLFIPVSFSKFLMSVRKSCSLRVSRASQSLSDASLTFSSVPLLLTVLDYKLSSLFVNSFFQYHSLSLASLFLSLRRVAFLCNFTLEFYFASFKLLSKRLNSILSPDPLKCSTSWERTHLIACIPLPLVFTPSKCLSLFILFRRNPWMQWSLSSFFAFVIVFLSSLRFLYFFFFLYTKIPVLFSLSFPSLFL